MYGTEEKYMKVWKWLFLALFLVHQSFAASGQDGKRIRIHISNVDRNIQKNWLGVPRRVDCTVSWEVYERRDDDWVLTSEDRLDGYRVTCQNLTDRNEVFRSGRVVGNFHSFQDLRVGIRYGFAVEAYAGEMQITNSDTAYVRTGKSMRAALSDPNVKWHHWLPFNGRIPLALFNKEDIFADSTRSGKIAFHLIWNFLLVGTVIWLFFCVKHLRLSHVFPMKNLIHFGGSYDTVYKRAVSDEFLDIVAQWRNLMDDANKHMRQVLEEGNHLSVQDIESVNIEFWKKDGAKRVQEILDKTRSPRLNKYPIIRIIQAGLENHELGGFRWMEVAKEVDRAIETRASSELERLRRSSLLDWLWNLGTMSPLVGLFGTATGISNAFVTLTMLKTDITQTALVKRLAGGIFEALWTTIEGLLAGIILMMLYYYYQNKLNWIYSKWEEIYVQVSERL